MDRWRAWWIELRVMLHIYLLAGIYALKELLFDRVWDKEGDEVPSRWRGSRTAVVTGADGTIGREMVSSLLRLGWRVHVVVREGHARRGEPYGVEGEDEARIVQHVCDFADRKQVSRLCTALSSLPPVDLLVCSAAVMLDEHTEEINVRSQLSLCHSLLSSARLAGDGCVLLLSSCCAHAARTDAALPALYSLGPYQSYALSKLALAVAAEELDRQYGVRVIAAHPGVVPGALYRHAPAPVRCVVDTILPWIMRSPARSASLLLRCVWREERGVYYENARVVEIHKGLRGKARSALIAYEF